MAEYLQVKLKRERRPFLFELAEGEDPPRVLQPGSLGDLRGNVVDERGGVLRLDDAIPHAMIAKVTRAIRAETISGGVIIAPVVPLK